MLPCFPTSLLIKSMIDYLMLQVYDLFRMSDDILNTIEVLTARVTAKETELNELKKLVNGLCSEAGLQPRFAHVATKGGSVAPIRSDQFYGQTLTAAIRNYLEH